MMQIQNQSFQIEQIRVVVLALMLGHFSLKREAYSNACECQWSFITFMRNLNTNCGQNISADRMRRNRIARRLVVTCYNSAKPPETSKCAGKRPKNAFVFRWTHK